MYKQFSKEQVCEMDRHSRAYFVNSLSGFKSANLIATKSQSGVSNLTLVSSGFHIGADPMLIGFLFRPDSVPRHGLTNIRETKQFTCNHVHEDFFEKAHQSTARYPDTVSEFDSVGLTETYLDDFRSPFIEESNIKFSCCLEQEITLDFNQTHLIIASIQTIYMRQDYLKDNGSIDLVKAGSVAVSSLDHYHSVKHGTQMP